MMKRNMKILPQRGFSLLEVVIAIGIFAIGMLALASLQGSLTRSSADANLRTVATNIAERTLENLRGFGLIDTDTNPIIADRIPAYADIADEATTTISDGGIPFSRTIAVTPYYYVLADDSFSATAPLGVAISDFKLVEVTVSWGDSAGFQIDESQNLLTSTDLGSGEIVLSAMMSSITTRGSARTATQGNGSTFTPIVNYTPGQNPDVISLSLGDTKFKETLTPEPEVFRDNMETRFDVVTYSQATGDSLFLRREEFVAVSCDCTLHSFNAANPDNKRPTVWAGDEYTEPESVVKSYGEPAANVDQSTLCVTCCRDHHDGGEANAGDPGSILYDPSRPAGEYDVDGDHKHYSSERDVNGDRIVAGNNQDYVEACKLVRKDGFFRVAQDFRLEGINAFAEDYLITPQQTMDYSYYVVDAVYKDNGYSAGEAFPYVNAALDIGNGYHTSDPRTPPVMMPPLRTPYGATYVSTTELTLGYTFLPASNALPYQNLHSRSTYIDYLSFDLRTVIACIESKGTVDPDDPVAVAAVVKDCKSGNVELDKTASINILELIPFFEIQTTFLNDWIKSDLTKSEFEVTSDQVLTGNQHIRGKVEIDEGGGDDRVTAVANRSVTGLTATESINNAGNVLAGAGQIQVVVTEGSVSNPLGKTITGKIVVTKIPGLKASDIDFSWDEANCSYDRGEGDFTCFVPDGASNPKMVFGNIQTSKNNTYVCSSDQAELPVSDPTLNNSLTKDIDLTSAVEDPTLPYVITLTTDVCSGGVF